MDPLKSRTTASRKRATRMLIAVDFGNLFAFRFNDKLLRSVAAPQYHPATNMKQKHT